MTVIARSIATLQSIRLIYLWIAMLTLAMTILPINLNAQEYVPPPLFETPSYSPEPKKRAVPIKTSEEPRTATRKTAPKPQEKPAFKVRDLSKEQNSRTVNKKKVAPPPNYRGVVKGPKTMPSAPAKSVESEVLFEAPEGQKLSSFQQKSESFDIKNKQDPDLRRDDMIVTPISKPKKIAEKIPPLPAFTTPKDGVLQSTLYFVSVTELLSDTNQKTIKHLIIPELQKNDKKRLLIQAYASSQKDVLNGDRRISLSRALNIRRFLVENGINPSRLDVRALGANTNTQPLDRVELLIIS